MQNNFCDLQYLRRSKGPLEFGGCVLVSVFVDRTILERFLAVTNEQKITRITFKVILRQTVSRPVCHGVKSRSVSGLLI
jgi:hypothetical protein